MKSEEVFYTLAYMEGIFLVQVFVSYEYLSLKNSLGVTSKHQVLGI